MHFALIIMAVAVAVFPAFFTWRRERRLNRLSKARLAIAESVTEMERLMLKGDLCLGNVSHDTLFIVMQKVQYSHTYFVTWNLLKPRSQDQVKFEEALTKEIKQPDCVFRQPLDKFTVEYARAFRLQHPWISKLYFLNLCMTLISLASLLALFKAILHLSLLRQRIAKIKKKFQEKLLAQSGALLLAEGSA